MDLRQLVELSPLFRDTQLVHGVSQVVLGQQQRLCVLQPLRVPTHIRRTTNSHSCACYIQGACTGCNGLDPGRMGHKTKRTSSWSCCFWALRCCVRWLSLSIFLSVCMRRYSSLRFMLKRHVCTHVTRGEPMFTTTTPSNEQRLSLAALCELCVDAHPLQMLTVPH